MTKFELPEKPKKTNTSEDFNNLRKAVDELDKFDYAWKTYANKADRRINAANKYIEELERENQRLVAENLALKTLVDNAKPQQPLPVVPECVDIWIKKCQELNWIITDVLAPESWSSDFAKDTENWLKKSKENFNLLALAFITGKYQVEKPQLFRVCLLDGRHTLTRRDPRKTLPFNYTFLWSYSSELKEMREINRKVDLFTEQEIKSIDERYWQFAVPVEDGE